MEKEILIPEGYEARIEGNKVILEPKENKDEKIRKSIIKLIQLGGYMSPADKTEALAYLERQKGIVMHTPRYAPPEQKEQEPAEGTALQKAFISSKIDYTLEEKCDASNYADTILPTSVAYGENEEEYKLHKIIEAAFIAGQKKEQKPAEWSKEDVVLIDLLVVAVEDFYDKKNPIRVEIINFLKSLRPQPKVVWSEEDVKKLAKIRESKSGTLKTEMTFYRQGVRDAFNYKGFRPSWKPSEEQMNALNSIILNGSFTYVGQVQDLISLKDELKKL